MRWLVPFVLVATTFVACGDDGPGYVEQVEAACDVRDGSFNDLVQPIPADFSPEYIDRVVQGSVEIIQTYLDAVRDIGPPGGELDEQHEAYVELLTDTLERYEDAAGDPEASAAIFNQPAPEYAELEAALGLETCGQPGNGIEEPS